jgi:hypothetical protein
MSVVTVHKRSGTAMLAGAALAALLAVACSEGGNGNGTAPAPPPPCPAAPPAEGSACTALQICEYCSGALVAADSGSCAEPLFAYCPGSVSTWRNVTRGDAGGFSDAAQPDALDDAADATDALEDAADADALDDAADATDALEDATDALDDAADATDAAGALDAPDASDAPDAG